MKILLTGGGSGGHITPLLAVARELKKLDPSIAIVAICEKNAKFVQLFHDEAVIDEVYQVSAGKYRRYPGLTHMQRLLNFGVHARNTRDIGRVCVGYVQARRLLNKLKPDGILIKGGYVGVPVGLAAAHLKIPFITHDSDSVAGLANQIIGRWALKHATGMPIEFYDYPKESTVYVGVPVSDDFIEVTPDLKKKYRKDLGLDSCKQLITIIGASQGGAQLNEDMLSIAGRLMQQHPGLGIIHIAGPAHEREVKRRYNDELLADESRRVLVKGFVNDVFCHTGAADIVVSRASATVVAELSVQGKTTILVPGQLAGDHQAANAKHLESIGAVMQVENGDGEELYVALRKILNDETLSDKLARSLNSLAKPHAAADLAKLLLNSFSGGKVGSA